MVVRISVGAWREWSVWRIVTEDLEKIFCGGSGFEVDCGVGVREAIYMEGGASRFLKLSLIFRVEYLAGLAQEL